MTDPPYDDPLRQRMSQLQIPSWQALRHQAGISRRALDHLRQGTIETLKLGQLRSVANTLEWSLEDLLSTLGILSTQPRIPPIPKTLSWRSNTRPSIDCRPC